MMPLVLSTITVGADPADQFPLKVAETKIEVIWPLLTDEIAII